MTNRPIIEDLVEPRGGSNPDLLIANDEGLDVVQRLTMPRPREAPIHATHQDGCTA